MTEPCPNRQATMVDPGLERYMTDEERAAYRAYLEIHPPVALEVDMTLIDDADGPSVRRRRPRWRTIRPRPGFVHNVIAHPLLVLFPPIGERLHARTDPGGPDDPEPDLDNAYMHAVLAYDARYDELEGRQVTVHQQHESAMRAAVTAALEHQ